MARLSLVTVLVPDYDEAIAFYGAIPGFALIADEVSTGRDRLGRHRRWVVVGSPDGGTRLLIARADDAAQTAAIGKPVGGRVAFFLETDDFARDAGALVRIGAVFEEPPRVEPYGKVAVWRDPFGYRWDLIEPFVPRG